MCVTEICAKSIKGASHIRNGKGCQDSFKIVKLDNDKAVVAVADGHGSPACPFSKTGSQIAVNVFCDYFSKYSQDHKSVSEQQRLLKRERELFVAKEIEKEWKRRVIRSHKRNNRLIENEPLSVYRRYGTTLLGVYITESFIFSFQIGDGDIVAITNDKIFRLISNEFMLGTETHSLCEMNSWRKARCNCTALTDNSIIALFSDGFFNCYKSEADFFNSVIEYSCRIVVEGRDFINRRLMTWLKSMSNESNGDDITGVFVKVDK